MDDYSLISAGLKEDIERLGQIAARFREGGVSLDEFRRAHVPMGVYQQRREGAYMLRIRLPAGILTSAQMVAIADATERFGSGAVHVTTRQDIQIHNVAVENIAPALAMLLDGGLGTKGGCGDTVRNVTACWLCGVCPKEQFDVGPHCLNLATALLGDGESFQLPRKFKIAFSGCCEDCAGGCVNDVGLIACARDGVEGFRVYAGGGMGARSRVSELLEDFVPAAEIYRVVRAIRSVFNRYGNRENRAQARLRFLMDKIGFQEFAALYRSALAEADGSAPPLGFAPAKNFDEPVAAADSCAANPPGFDEWFEFSTQTQKQAGFRIVHIGLRLGDISARSLRSLAGVISAFPTVEARTTQWQNLILQWVPEVRLREIYLALDAIGLATKAPPWVRDMVCCTGASTCRMGLCVSRGLANVLYSFLQNDSEKRVTFSNVSIGISGCPNACGRHLICGIGLSGAVRTVEGMKVPHYRIYLGGRRGEGMTTFAEPCGMVPARQVPHVLSRFLSAFRVSEVFPDFEKFLATGGREFMVTLCIEKQKLPSYAQEPIMYLDYEAPDIRA